MHILVWQQQKLYPRLPIKFILASLPKSLVYPDKPVGTRVPMISGKASTSPSQIQEGVSHLTPVLASNRETSPKLVHTLARASVVCNASIGKVKQTAFH